LALLTAFAAQGQSIHVYTEFQRTDPFGRVIEADRGTARSREVLSPPLARNGVASFLVSVEAPQGTPYWLYMGLNPEASLELTAYRAVFEQNAKGEWVPDKLVKLELPYNGLVPEKHIPGQTHELFLLDVRVPADLPPQRIKVEPQLWIPDRWITYPMEVRVVRSQITSPVPQRGEIFPVDAPADLTYRSVFYGSYCNSPEKKVLDLPLTIRSLILRNARQDAAVASSLGKSEAGSLLDYQTGEDWCKTPLQARPAGPERVLRLRDRLLRERP